MVDFFDEKAPQPGGGVLRPELGDKAETVSAPDAAKASGPEVSEPNKPVSGKSSRTRRVFEAKALAGGDVDSTVPVGN
jgi:hypothetical protein